MADPTDMSRKFIVLMPSACRQGRRQQNDDDQEPESPMAATMSSFGH
jgi:hypothetical protein